MQSQEAARALHLSGGGGLRQADKSSSYHLMFVNDPDKLRKRLIDIERDDALNHSHY